MRLIPRAKAQLTKLADGNELTMLLFGAACPQLRILRASGNRLDDFDVSTLPNLRTLFLDDTAVQRLAGIARLRKLENLSLRHEQAHDGLCVFVSS